YVRDPHDVVAVGDQVRAWVTAIDNERRRVALTMIAPGTEKPRPAKSRGPRRRPTATQPAQPQPSDGAPPVAERRAPPPRRAAKPSRDRGKRGAPPRQPRTGAYEKRAKKTLVPITKAMEEGKEFMRSFGDLLQYHQKKKEQEEPGDEAEPPAGANGSAQSERQPDKETRRQGE
ncbi:MAG: hypothetical protein WD229_04505, partial [Pirellulales bacterium]